MLKKFLKRVRRGLQFRSVIHQLVLYTLLLSLIPLTVNLYVVVGTAHQLIRDELLRSYGLLHRQYITNVEYKLRLYREGLSKLADNPLVRDSLMEVKSGKSENPYQTGSRISQEVGTFLQGSADWEIGNCMVYADSGEYMVYGKKVAPAATVRAESWYPHYRDRTGDFFVTPGANPVVSLLQDIRYIDSRNLTSQEVGFIKLDIPGNSLFDPLSGSAEDYRYTVVVTGRDGALIFTTHEGEVPELEPPPGQGYIYHKGNHIISRASLSGYGLEVCLLFDIQQVNDRLDLLMLSVAPYALAAVLMILFVTFLYSGRFKRRIRVLVNKMRAVEEGNLAVTEQVGGRDEIRTLDKNFNHMVRQLDRSIQENYVQALEKKEIEFRNLQLQINPHFLYNTLETVASIAAVHDVNEICEITSRLGDIFRYSLGQNAGSHVTVRQELTHTQNYVFIQKVRFGDKLEARFDVEEHLLSCMIMRFLLQPLVENAILHGLAEKRGKGVLEVSAREEGGCLVFTVRDDGVGMTAEQLDLLTARIEGGDGGGGGIGVLNVHQRIRMMYGSGYGITIRSRPGEGSSFSVTLPMRPAQGERP